MKRKRNAAWVRRETGICLRKTSGRMCTRAISADEVNYHFSTYTELKEWRRLSVEERGRTVYERRAGNFRTLLTMNKCGDNGTSQSLLYVMPMSGGKSGIEPHERIEYCDVVSDSSNGWTRRCRKWISKSSVKRGARRRRIVDLNHLKLFGEHGNGSRSTDIKAP